MNQSAEDRDREGRPPVIETASATTSPDNKDSGPFAYVLTAVVVGLLAPLMLGFSGCASSLGQVGGAWSLREGPLSPYGSPGYEDELERYLDDWLDPDDWPDLGQDPRYNLNDHHEGRHLGDAGETVPSGGLASRV